MYTRTCVEYSNQIYIQLRPLKCMYMYIVYNTYMDRGQYEIADIRTYVHFIYKIIIHQKSQNIVNSLQHFTFPFSVPFCSQSGRTVFYIYVHRQSIQPFSNVSHSIPAITSPPPQPLISQPAIHSYPPLLVYAYIAFLLLHSSLSIYFTIFLPVPTHT